SAVDAGVTMVFAQGNEGPGEETGNLPGNSPKVIAVGAVTKNTTISPGRVTAKDGDNADVPGTPFDVGPSGFGPQDPGNIASTAYAPVETVDPGSSPLACDPLPATSLDGKIAVISRGTCDFSLKVYNAQQAGAVAAFVYNSAANGNNLQAMGPGEHAADVTIPSFFLRRSNGLALVNATPGGTAAYTKDSHVAENIGDVVAGFSSRGPSAGKQIKPDLAAPGVDVVSAGYNGTVFPEKYTGFGSASGTSMATPHVAGAAALLKALHPAWTPAQVKSALMNTATDQVFLDTAHSNQAGVLDRGAGRIDLSEAIDPGLSLDVPSVSAGERPAGTGQTTAVKATNLDPGVQTWSLSTDVDTAGLNIDLSKSTLTAGPGGTAAFNVTLSTESGAEPGDYEGSVVLENLTAAKTLHIPVFLRVVVDAPTTDVLLVDDDGSAAADGFADYASFYQGLLEDLGLSYDYIEPWNDGFLPLGMLKEYRTVLLFTGENDSWDTSGFFVEDQDALNAYLNGGGRLLAMGQNLAETTDSNTDFDSPRIGRSRLYHGYLGIEQDAANSYPVGAPRPTATGANWLDGMTLDLTPGGNAAGGQDSIEATSPMPNTDTYSAAHAVSTILAAAPGGAVPAGAAFGHTKSSEPSLEETRQEFLYRTLSLGFGLEGLRSDTGHTSASALADKAFKWAFDEVTASINGGAFSSAEPVTLTAEASSTKGTVDQFRWDFGDGTPFATTEGPSASHRYAKGGTYPVRLEVTDSFGHRAVTTRKIAVGTGQGFRLLGEDGGVFGYGKRYFGSANELGLAAPIVGGAPTPSGLGYWLVGEDGGVFNYGDAGFFGSLGGMDLPSPIVGMAATPNGQGYWLATADGQVYRFGDAVFHGSMGGQQLNSPIVGIAAMPHGIGYWLVGADGGVFAYGNAGFFGSAGGLELNAPVVGMFASPSGDGYWLAASDGGVFDYGDAGFFGSAGSVDLVSPVVGIAPTPTGEGYWLAAADGGVF
ncbi:MAG TPA: S8 family serine peptidase, partial [Acidimicrobiales bacterium]|nr:S8 family serine peptidase [Acidimicrobiales bacterium]